MLENPMSENHVNQHDISTPLSHEDRLNLKLWIQELEIEIELAEEHFGCQLPDNHDLKIQLSSLYDAYRE